MSADDEQILAQLLTQLDIDSAIATLRKLGFCGIKYNGEYHMYRVHPHDSASIEELDIAMIPKNSFKLTWNRSSCEYVQTWDQWLDFIRSVTPAVRVSRNDGSC